MAKPADKQFRNTIRNDGGTESSGPPSFSFVFFIYFKQEGAELKKTAPIVIDRRCRIEC